MGSPFYSAAIFAHGSVRGEFVRRAGFDMVESNTLPRRLSSLPGGKRSRPLTRNVRAKRAHADLSPTGRREEELARRYQKMLYAYRFKAIVDA